MLMFVRSFVNLHNTIQISNNFTSVLYKQLVLCVVKYITDNVNKDLFKTQMEKCLHHM